MEVDPTSLERLEEPNRHVAITVGCDLGEHLEDRHLGPDLAEVGGQLEPDVAAADDGDALGHLGEVEDAVRVEDMLGADPRYGRDRRPRSGGDQDVLGLQLLVPDLNPVASLEAGTAGDHLDAGALELGGHPPAERRHDPVLAFDHDRGVEAHPLDPHPERSRLVALAIEAG